MANVKKGNLISPPQDGDADNISDQPVEPVEGVEL